MGLFSRKNQEERQAEGMAIAEQMASGKGLTGRLSKAFMGAEAHEQMQNAMQQGFPMTRAVVGEINFTGAMVNNNPMVTLKLTIEGGSPEPVTLETLVPAVQVPRVSDVVLLTPNPSDPSLFIYAGPAL